MVCLYAWCVYVCLGSSTCCMYGTVASIHTFKVLGEYQFRHRNCSYSIQCRFAKCINLVFVKNHKTSFRQYFKSQDRNQTLLHFYVLRVLCSVLYIYIYISYYGNGIKIHFNKLSTYIISKNISV